MPLQVNASEINELRFREEEMCRFTQASARRHAWHDRSLPRGPPLLAIAQPIRV